MITADFILSACAIIRKNNEVLLAKKIEKLHPAGLEGKWHFPGGVVENRETLEEALRREMREELGIEIEINELVGIGHNFNPNWKGKRNYAVLVYFECFPKSKKIRPSDDIVDVKWVKGKEISEHLKDMERMLGDDVKKYLAKLIGSELNGCNRNR